MRAKTIAGVLLVIFAACIAAPVEAANAQPPDLPHAFYGTVKINNADAPVGTTIRAVALGVVFDSTNPYITTEAGKYGSTNPLAEKARLLVQGDIAPGVTIEFFVNGVKANETAAFQSGQDTVLNLTAGAQAPVTPAPPSVVTGGAADITSNSATLFATLISLGTSSSVNVRFEYGATTAYGSSTPVQALSQAITFNAPVAGLAPGTLYHYRAKAEGASGTALGADAAFTAPVPGSAAPTVFTENATGITGTSVTLNGNLTALGTATSANVSFDWGTASGAYSASTVIQPKMAAGTFSAGLSGLNANTTYYYRARAQAGIHGTGFGTEKTFTTLGGTSGTGGGGGGGGAVTQSGRSVKLDGLSSDRELAIDDSGKTLTDARLSDAEKRVSVSILSGTAMKGPSGNPIDSISLSAPAEIPPAPPQNFVVTAREFGPGGATFDPPIILTLVYTQADLPAGADESTLVIAFWDGGKWVGLPTAVNTSSRTLSAFVSHFTIFGILTSSTGTVSDVSAGTPTPAPSPAPGSIATPPGSSQPPTPAPISPQPSAPAPAPVAQPGPSPAGTNWALLAGVIALVAAAAVGGGFFLGRKTTRS